MCKPVLACRKRLRAGSTVGGHVEAVCFASKRAPKADEHRIHGIGQMGKVRALEQRTSKHIERGQITNVESYG